MSLLWIKENSNVLDRLREILGPQIEAKNKIIQLLKEIHLYKLIENENYKL